MDTESVRVSDLRLAARDGFLLSASLFETAADRSRVVVISSATAVPRRFYRHFAAGLADAGYATITYDYRGIGGSRPASLRGFDARTRDWGLLDMAGILDWARAELRPERLFMVGHSVGGQVAGLLGDDARLDGMVTVSAQSGYWGLQGGGQKWLAALHVYLTLPLLARVCGYMPWSLFSAAEDLPKGAALEWSRWCRDPRYLLGDRTLPLERFGDFGSPILAYSIDDDDWGTKRAVDAMMAAYPDVERRHIVPAEHGLASLGHFGYFRPDAKPAWSDAIEWMGAL